MSDKNIASKLTVIFYADVVGYSRLSGVDEKGTHQRVMQVLDDAAGLITGKGGTVLRYAGDAILAEFGSLVTAVNTALAIQRELLKRNQDIVGDQGIQLRIGINLGEVLLDRSEIYGDGVNLAARLEAAAKPGGVCISSAVHDQVMGKVDALFTDGGAQRLKNIEKPVKLFHWHPATATGICGPVDSVQARPAIAVLPFTNMSGDSEQEYFSDGLTEDIITALSHWRSNPVIARNSTFIYKGKSIRVQQVAEDLGARYVLEGGVRKAGNRLRITAQLIDAESGHHVWAEKFDRQIEDVFDIQDEITTKIAAAIVPELEHFESRRTASKPTGDLNAWDLYLRGMEAFSEEDCASVARSQQMFLAAVEKDPDYSDAWARLGWTYARQISASCIDDVAETLRIGFEAARKAVSLDPASAVAHMSLGTVHIWAGETELGLAEALRALELNPNFAQAAMAVGNRLDLMGQSREGIERMEFALKLNPRDPIRWVYMAYLSRAYISLKEFEKAAQWGKQALLLRSGMPEAMFRYAVCLAHLDRVDEARSLLERCSVIDPDFLARKLNWQPYPDQARNEHVMDGLIRHGLVPAV